MRISNIGFFALFSASFICAQAFGAGDAPAKKKTLNNFYSEEFTKIQKQAYDKVAQDSKDPEFIRKELLGIYSNLETQRQVSIQKTLYAFANEIQLAPLSQEEIAEARHILEMKIKVLSILASLPSPAPKPVRPDR